MSDYFTRLKPYQRSLLSAFVGFVFYGAWAYWVNMSHGTVASVKAACVQGSYSFLLTFVMTMLIEFLYRSIFAIFNNGLLIIWLTIALTCCLIFSTSWWVNVFAGTPEILETVILGYLIGGLYTVIYVYNLAQVRVHQDN